MEEMDTQNRLLKNLDSELKKIVTDYMMEKYNQKFVITFVGKRLNTESATLYACSTEAPIISVKIVYRYKDHSVRDNYTERLVAHRYEVLIRELIQDVEGRENQISVQLDGNEAILLLTWIVRKRSLKESEKEKIEKYVRDIKQKLVVKMIRCEVYTCSSENWEKLKNLYKSRPICQRGDLWRVTNGESVAQFIVG